MAAGEQDLFALLDELGIEHRTYRHEPVFTVEENRSLRGALPGAHCKNLFLKDKASRHVLAVVMEDRRLDVKALARVEGLGVGRLSFAKPQELEALLGVTPGSVTPFALMNARGRSEIAVVLDADMLAAGLVNYHPLHNAATTTVSSDALLTFVRHCGFEPHIVDFERL